MHFTHVRKMGMSFTELYINTYYTHLSESITEINKLEKMWNPTRNAAITLLQKKQTQIAFKTLQFTHYFQNLLKILTNSRKQFITYCESHS